MQEPFSGLALRVHGVQPGRMVGACAHRRPECAATAASATASSASASIAVVPARNFTRAAVVTRRGPAPWEIFSAQNPFPRIFLDETPARKVKLTVPILRANGKHATPLRNPVPRDPRKRPAKDFRETRADVVRNDSVCCLEFRGPFVSCSFLYGRRRRRYSSAEFMIRPRVN